MKVRYSYYVDKREHIGEYSYIPVRYIIAIALTILAILAIIGGVAALCWYSRLFYITTLAASGMCVVHIVASDDNPDYKVPWLLVVTVVPVAGFMLYVLFYSRKLKKKYVRRLQELKDSAYKYDDTEVLRALEKENSLVASQARMLCGMAETHIFTNTRQIYYPLGEDMHRDMLLDLEEAEKFIYLEYFIIEEGRCWNAILEILKRKAADGLDVRVVYDDVGCMKTLPGDYWKTLSRMGISTVPFSRLRGNADSEFNNRSHRKLMIIDGKIGYTGGMNLADEYINVTPRFGHWKDGGIRLEGEAVWELTKLFLIDYGINAKKAFHVKNEHFPEQKDITEPGYLIPFGDGPRPVYHFRISKSVIQNILNSATRYVYMTTPYLIIDNELCKSIENAALRGVDVRIILPHIPDKKMIFAMSRSYYRRLMNNGVKIYEYEPGFMHAKSYIADDEYAMVGTVNLDYRSLVHHFENGVWMYRCDSIAALKADIDDTLTRCIPVTEEMLKTGLIERIIRSLVRFFSPML